MCLEIGKLDSYTPFNRSNLKEYYSSDNSFDFTNSFDKLKKIVNSDTKIRVWSSHLDSDDYCLLLLICYLFKENKVSAIFSEEISWYATTLGCIDEKEVVELENKEHILKEYEKEDYYNEWIKIVNDNKELRYMLNGKVISCDINYFDKDILKRLEQLGKIYIYNLVADLMINPIIPGVRYADFIYLYLIERLEKQNYIKSSMINDKKYVELN